MALSQLRKRLRVWTGGGRPDRGSAVGLAVAASTAVLLGVTVMVWVLSSLVSTSWESPESPLGRAGAVPMAGRATTTAAASAAATADEVAALQAAVLRAAPRQRPAAPAPAALLFVGAGSVARAARAKALAAAAAVEAGRAAGDWGGGTYAGRVFAAPAAAAAAEVVNGGAAAARAAAPLPSQAAADWSAVEMVAVGRHVVRVVTPGAAVWAVAAAAESAGRVTVVVAEADEVARWATALRLLTLGGDCRTIGEVLVHAAPAGTNDEDAVDDVVRLLRHQLLRRGGAKACAAARAVAAVVPPPAPVALPAPDPIVDPPPRAAADAAAAAATSPLPVVHYAMLSGAATFASRIPAAAASWLPALPPGDVVIYTDALPPVAALDTLPLGVAVTVTGPARPDAELNLPRMSAWSHLTRVRDAWDHTLAARPEVTHLALIDDDTFVFPGALPPVVASSKTLANGSGLAWGGFLELIRVDNGDGRDGGVFAVALRATHIAAGGTPCTLPFEVAANLTATAAATNSTGARGGGGGGGAHPSRRPLSCADVFCRRCASVPQGAAVVLTRALVAALRPSMGACEAATARLCARCGSQRLFLCVHQVARLGSAAAVTTHVLPGVRRDTWRREPIGGSARAVTFHAFDRGRRPATGSMRDEMRDLMNLARARPGGVVALQDVADTVGCPEGGRWVKRVGVRAASNGTCVRR